MNRPATARELRDARVGACVTDARGRWWEKVSDTLWRHEGEDVLVSGPVGLVNGFGPLVAKPTTQPVAYRDTVWV